MASAPDSKQHGGHPLTRSLVPRTTAPPNSHTRQSSQTSAANPESLSHPAHNDPIDSAMNASSRTGRSLSELLEVLGQFQASVSGARDTQEHLQVELEHIRALLGRTNTERLALKNRVAALETELAERGDITELDASYVQEEQDRFIAALIDEYDEELAALRAERDQAWAQLGLASTTTDRGETIPSPAPNDDLDEARQRTRTDPRTSATRRKPSRRAIREWRSPEVFSAAKAGGAFVSWLSSSLRSKEGYQTPPERLAPGRETTPKVRERDRNA
jgi:hypothetical protein